MFEEILECEYIEEIKEIIADVINDDEIDTDLEELEECLKEMTDEERITKIEMDELMEFAADLVDGF